MSIHDHRRQTRRDGGTPRARGTGFTVRHRTALAAAALAGLLGGCASSPGSGDAAATGGLAATTNLVQPFTAIQAAAADPARGLPGVFVLQVQNGTRADNGVYLNSEDDARDQRNLSVVVRRDALAGLEAAYGAPLEKSLRGKRLLVNGVAKRVRIDFTVDGAPSGKYYYQTHVEVREASQVRVQPLG